MVLAHGWTCSTAFWAASVRDLADDHRVIVYDQRGHGRSPAAGPGGYSTGALADDLEAVLEATLAPGERAVLGGHSMGGMTIMAAAEPAAVREHAPRPRCCAAPAARLAAESLVLPAARPGRLRTRADRGDPRLPRPARAGHAGRQAGPASTPRWAPRPPPNRSRPAPGSCTPARRGVRSPGAQVLAGLDLDAGYGPAERADGGRSSGTADRLTPPVHARRLAAALPRLPRAHRAAGHGAHDARRGTGGGQRAAARARRDHLRHRGRATDGAAPGQAADEEKAA